MNQTPQTGGQRLLLTNKPVTESCIIFAVYSLITHARSCQADTYPVIRSQGGSGCTSLQTEILRKQSEVGGANPLPVTLTTDAVRSQLMLKQENELYWVDNVYVHPVLARCSPSEDDVLEERSRWKADSLLMLRTT
jgi:hypothetical protein